MERDHEDGRRARRSSTLRPRSRSAIRALLLVALALLVLGITATPASAHTTAGTTDEASDYRYRIDEFEPGVDGITLSFVSATGQLELTNTSAVEVTVLGYEGEPYLRVGPDGVFVNDRSPATTMNADASGATGAPADADASAEPIWREVSDGSSTRWHDHRAHWMVSAPAEVTEQPDEVHELARWEIPFTVGGDQVVAAGTILWVPGPDPVPWIVAALVLFLLIALAAALPGWRVSLAVAAVVLVAAAVADALGAWAASPAATSAKLGGLGLPVLAVLFLLCGLAYLPRHELDATVLLAGGAIGLFLLFGWTSRSYLTSSQIPTELPGSLARATVVVALGLGAGLALAPLVRWWRRRATPAS